MFPKSLDMVIISRQRADKVAPLSIYSVHTVWGETPSILPEVVPGTKAERGGIWAHQGEA